MNPAADVASNAGAEFSLLSPVFGLFALTAIIASVAAQRSVLARNLSCLAASLVFVALAGFDWIAALLVAAFVHLTYFLVLFVRRRSDPVGRATSVAFVILFWVVLFWFKNPASFASIHPSIAAPIVIIGASYFCFRAISALMDAADLDDIDYLSFINYMIFFPTILAGPIERYDNFRSRIVAPVFPDGDGALAALRRITLGYVKKFVLADNLAPFGIFAFSGDTIASAPVWLIWFAVLFQLFLIFLDFSGYTDIMIGIGRLMGFDLPENFNRPYLARNVQQFWDSWHMSLTSFVRDYVFTPICRFIMWHVDRRRQLPYILATYFFTMIVIALWHKISLGFLLFGIMHGSALVFLLLKRQFLESSRIGRSRLGSLVLKPPAILAAAMTWTYFSISTFVWFFPAATSLLILRRIFGL